MGWGGVGWDNNVHVPVHPQAQQPHHLSCCPADTGSDGGVGWGGVGWDNNVHVPVHPQAQQPHHLSCCPAGTGSDGGVGWGGVGWDNNVHVPVHPQAQQPHHLSCSPADTGSDGGVGWGGVGIITFMFPCTHRHSNLIIFLAVLQTQAVMVGWDGVGWVGYSNNVHVPVHPQAQQPHHLSCCPADTGSDLSR